MSLRSSRNLRQALSAAAALTLLAGCAGGPPPDLPTAAVQPAVPNSANSATLTYWGTIGGAVTGNRWTGYGSRLLVRPTAVGARGKEVFIYDAGTFRLYRYDTGRKTLTIFKYLGDLVSSEVTSIYVAPDMSVYVTDTDGGRVLYFNARGKLVRMYGADINLIHPVGVRVDESAGEVMVADGSNDFILVFDRQGNVRRTVGSRGQGPGHFLNITAMDLSDHHFYVGARFPLRLQVMDERGAFVRQIETGVRFPTAVAVDDRGRLYVGDYLDNTIKVYDAAGHLIDTAGGTGVGPGRFKRIAGLWVDQGYLYVADSLNARVQIMRIAH